MTHAICHCDAVSEDEIRRLGKRFQKLDADDSGTLSTEEFLALPELQQVTALAGAGVGVVRGAEARRYPKDGVVG